MSRVGRGPAGQINLGGRPKRRERLGGTSPRCSAAFGASVAEILQNLTDQSYGCAVGKPGRRLPTRGIQSSLAGMRVAEVLHPTMLLALADRAGLPENRYGPPP